MSKGKKLFAMSLLTFILLVVVGAMWNHHGDASGTSTGGLSDYLNTTGQSGPDVPVSQVGINQLANEAGHLRISINFTWLLLTGFLVLFMQVGFAFLVTGLTRAKNAGHMMMMNIASFAIALIAYYAVGFAFQFGGVSPVSNLGGLGPLSGIFPHGSSAVIGTHGFFLQSGHGYDVGVLAMFLFQVVFMETAGYIIIGAIAERISFAGFIVAELAIGAIVYPIYGGWVWGGGWLAHLGQSLHLGHGVVDLPAPAWSTRQEVGPRSPSPWCSDRGSESSTKTERPTPSLVITSVMSSPEPLFWCSAGWVSTRGRRWAPPISASPWLP